MSNIEKIKAKIENSIKAFEFNGGIYDPYEAGELSAYKEILDFIDSLPEDDPLNDPRFGDGFDAGRAVQRIFDETKEKPSEDLEKAAKDYAILPMDVGDGRACIDKKKERAFIAGAEWMESQMPMPEDTVIFMKGVAEGRRLEREDRKDDNLPRYYGD